MKEGTERRNRWAPYLLKRITYCSRNFFSRFYFLFILLPSCYMSCHYEEGNYLTRKGPTTRKSGSFYQFRGFVRFSLVQKIPMLMEGCFFKLKPSISAKAHGHTSLWDYFLGGFEKYLCVKMDHFQSLSVSSTVFSRMPGLNLVHEGLNNIFITIQLLWVFPVCELFTCNWAECDPYLAFSLFDSDNICITTICQSPLYCHFPLR